MGKGIDLIYKHRQYNWPYPSPNTTLVLPQRPETSIQIQRNSACYASVFAHDLESSVSDQTTIHHDNTNVNNNDDPQSFETPSKNNRISSCFGDTITTTTIQNLFKLPPPEKEFFFNN